MRIEIIAVLIVILIVGIGIIGATQAEKDEDTEP